jgi:serpin B
MRIRLSIISLGLLMWFVSTFALAEETTGSSYSLANRQLKMAMEILARATPENNRVVSPLSIHACLTLVALGARGETANQMNELLFGSRADNATLDNYRDLLAKIFEEREGAVNRIANSLWFDTGIRLEQEYQQKTSSLMKASLHTISFAESEVARAKINGWVSSLTEKLIPQLIPPGAITPQTSLALVNALYFKERWKTSFSKKLTSEQPFSLPSGRSRAVPTMTTTLTSGYLERDQWKATLLPYSSNDFALVLAVPKSTLAMKTLINSFPLQLVEELLTDDTKYAVTVHLPRFTSRYSANIVKQLAEISGPLPFSSRADFTGIAQVGLSISMVQHESVVIVDEEGTEAAAATAVIMLRSLAPAAQPEPREVRADKPFMFVLIHTPSRTPLFVGVVADPA